MNNLGIESETLEFKKSTSELKEAMIDVGAILNKHKGGILYFGVKNNGDICGQEIGGETLNDVATAFKNSLDPMIYPKIELEKYNGLNVIKVEFKGSEIPYSVNGRYYKRVNDRSESMSPIELRHMMLNTDYFSIWENNLTPFGIEKVDLDALHSFYKEATSCERLEPLKDYSDKKLLSSLGLIRDDKLTNAGYYLFANDGPVVLKTAIYVTDARLNFSDINRINTNIYKATDIALEFIKEKMTWKVAFNNNTTKRIEIPEVPIQALREVVVNAFAHANYISVTEHQIIFTPSMIEIYNPGEFPIDYKPEDFANNNLPSIARNKKILEILYRSKNVEVQGSGLRKTLELCNEYNILYKYDKQSLGFKFVFIRNNTSEKVNANINKSINKTDLAVLSLLNENPKMSIDDIATTTGKTKRTIFRSIKRLEESGNLIKTSKGKSRQFELINK